MIYILKGQKNEICKFLLGILHRPDCYIACFLQIDNSCRWHFFPLHFEVPPV